MGEDQLDDFPPPRADSHVLVDPIEPILRPSTRVSKFPNRMRRNESECPWRSCPISLVCSTCVPIQKLPPESLDDSTIPDRSSYEIANKAKNHNQRHNYNHYFGCSDSLDMYCCCCCFYHCWDPFECHCSSVESENCFWHGHFRCCSESLSSSS